jgi:hypothetical protein
VTRADSTTTTIEASTLAEWPLTEVDPTPDQEFSTDRNGLQRLFDPSSES